MVIICFLLNSERLFANLIWNQVKTYFSYRRSFRIQRGLQIWL